MMFLLLAAMKTDEPAYILYDDKGRDKEFKDLVKSSLEADIILFGELHNNPISHWLQLELTRRLYEELGNNLILGAEMFEHDNSLILNEYVNNRIKESNFEKEAKLWDNYQTDYKPLVQFARDNGLDFIATNIPRRYAAIVAKEGFEGLSELSAEAKSHMVPLPVPYDPELNCYKKMLNMGAMGDAHTNENLPKAQAIKDATMAHFILQNRAPGTLFLHFNGAYHSDHYESIYWYLRKGDPALRILTITTVEQDDVGALDENIFGVADYIICVPSTMTKTY